MKKIIHPPIFVKNQLYMETKKSTGKYWAICFVWTAILIFMLATPSVRQFFWLALPGTATYFAKALDIM